jgi:tRNA(fMet)-specific endonuclease VapC
MPWLLDTNVWIHLWKDDFPTIRARIAATDEDDLYTCSIVKAELLYGACRYLKPDRRRTLIQETF